MKNYSLRGLLKLSVLMLAAVVTFTSCKDDPDPITVEDGFYIKGALTPFADLDSRGLFAAGVNEVDQQERQGMYEKYVTLKAGAAGFNIYQVEGQKVTTWGPATIEDYSPAGADYQINITIKRGTLGNTGVFTVPADGLYHIAIDKETGKFGLSPVAYALCGDPNGWSDTEITMDGAFSMTELNFKKENVTIRGNQKFKFRFGLGWKYNLNEGEDAVKVNTNFGGVISGTLPNLTSTLVSGGDDIVMLAANAGFYTVAMNWNIDDGFTATLTKTADIPVTNWTGVEVDIVGSGVSADNASSIADPSSWDWGRVIYPSGTNAPTVTGQVYKWTWNSVVFEANEGFKIRTKNGVAPAQNGANFDVGFGAVNTSASSAKVIDKDGNIAVNAKGSYKVELAIDAANGDAKSVTITEVK